MLTKGPRKFTSAYLGSVSTTGGNNQVVEARLEKAWLAFRATDKLWTSHIFGRATKVKIFNSNVKAILLYASKSWTVTQRTVDRTQVFINKCLKKILNTHWPDRITNKKLRKKTSEQSVLEYFEEENGTGSITH